MAGSSTTQQLPCMYCSEPVGSDGDTDDGEFFQCAKCRAEVELRRRAVVAGFNELSSVRITNGRPRDILCALFEMVTSGVLVIPAGKVVEVSGI